MIGSLSYIPTKIGYLLIIFKNTSKVSTLILVSESKNNKFSYLAIFAPLFLDDAGPKFL